MLADDLNTTEADRFSYRYLLPKYWLTWMGLGLTMIPAYLPYPVLLVSGRWIGRLLYRMAKKRVHIARVNLSHCFPDMPAEDRELLLKKNFESVGIGLIEVTMAWWRPRKSIEKLVRYEGTEHLESVDNKGTILLILHFTTIELAGAMIAMKHSLDATYREHKNPVFEYMQRKQRLRYDQNSHLLGRRDVRGMLRSLRKGRTVWYSPDQDYGPKQSVFAPFFGVQTASVTGTARLTKMGKARIVPLVMTRLPGSEGYRMTFLEPWEDFPSGDDELDASRVNQFVEQQVKVNPEQYMWLHRRFKTRPNNETDFYK